MKTALALVALVAIPFTARGQGAPPAAPAPPESYVYTVDGRRDPFQNQVGTGTDAGPAERGEGAAGLTLSEITVRGVMQSRGSLIAMIQGANNRTYVIHPGDRLADGVVRAVTPEGLIVLQDINDPLSSEKQREVRKLLRSLEGAKE
ncbi:MAG: hypothetical protein GEU82_01935 [Luteitalea sp.]|nr:hypothetical protein [Luteitalea sp.]